MAIWITKGLFIFVICIAEWNVCSNLDNLKFFDFNTWGDSLEGISEKVMGIGITSNFRNYGIAFGIAGEGKGRIYISQNKKIWERIL